MQSKSKLHSSPRSSTLIHPELLDCLAAVLARDPETPGGPDHRVTPGQLAQLIPTLRTTWVLDATHVPMISRTPPVSRRTVPGAKGAPDVTVYIVGSYSTKPRPAILHMHGGGFIVGQAADYLPVLQAQSLALDCLIVSVEYRLAPETPFPGALEDNYSTLKWVFENAHELGVDPARIAVQGESAGGGHAAMLAIAARDRGEVPILFQCLTYPMLDDRTGSTRMVPPHIGTYCWTAKYNRMGWSALLGVPAGSPEVPHGSVPGRVEDLSGLPPTFIWVGSLDLFVAEDLDYARRLLHAGVPVELHVVPGVYHGFDGVAPGAAVTVEYKMSAIGALARAFGLEPHPETRSFLGPSGDNS